MPFDCAEPDPMDPLTYVRATFLPVRTDDLKPEARANIGARTIFQAAEVAESGAYAGQQRFNTLPSWRDATWIPRCDLSDVTAISSEEGLAAFASAYNEIMPRPIPKD